MLFLFSRGGLGQVGIIGSVTIPLVQAPKDICIFKLFYDDINAFVEDVQVYVANGNIDMIHAFLKPSSVVSKLVGEGKFSSSSSEFQSSIKACQFCVVSKDLIHFWTRDLGSVEHMGVQSRLTSLVLF